MWLPLHAISRHTKNSPTPADLSLINKSMSFLLIKSHLVQILQRIDIQCFVSKGQRKMKVLGHSFSSSRSCPVDAVYWIILDVWPNTSPMPSSFMKMSNSTLKVLSLHNLTRILISTFSKLWLLTDLVSLPFNFLVFFFFGLLHRTMRSSDVSNHRAEWYWTEIDNIYQWLREIISYSYNLRYFTAIEIEILQCV